MSELNPVLMSLAERRVWRDAGAEKRAFQPPMDPAAGGAPPGGAPPMDPAMGGAPPMDPMAGGMPPGGAPPMDPMAGGMPPGGAPPMDPSMMGAAPPVDPMAAGAAAAPPKMKPEQMMMMLDYRMYNMQQQMTAIMNGLNINLPPGALVMPPGAAQSPPAEAALPGGPQDPTQQAGVEPGGGGAEGGAGGSAIGAIDPIQGASPELAAGKMASAPSTPAHDEFLRDANANAPTGYHVVLVKHAEDVAPVADVAPHIGEPIASNTVELPLGGSALASLYRERTRGQ